MGIKSLFGFGQARDKPVRNYSNGEYSFNFGRSTSGKSVNEMTAMQIYQQNPLYEYAGTYADEGISGTNIKKRDEFNRMIADCRAGKIDMIITKSISRFARNTLDCLNYVRELKDLGIGIIFEKENINTLDAKDEVLLTILSSLAQDESRSISENCTWGIRRRFETGKHKMSTKRFLGYDTDERGKCCLPFFPHWHRTRADPFQRTAHGESAEGLRQGSTK